MRKLFFILFLIFPLLVGSQNQDDYNYFINKSVNTLYNNPDECIKLTQSLIINDKNGNNKIAYQGLLSHSYSLKGDYLNSIKTISSIREISSNNNTNYDQIYLNFSLADQFQNIGLYNQSSKILNTLKIEKDVLRNETLKGKILQLQAINLAVNKEYDDALKLFDESSTYFNETSEENTILKIENKLFKGIVLTNQKKWKEAIQLFEIVLQDNNLSNYNFLYALARENASRAYFLNQNIEKSIFLLNEALNKIKVVDFKQLKGKIYEGLSNAYLSQKNEKEYKYYRELFNENKTELDNSRKSAINFLVNELEKVEKQEVEFKTQDLKFTTKILFSITLFVILVLISIYFYTAKVQKDLDKQIVFFEKINEKNKALQLSSENIKNDIIVVNTDNKKSNLLSEEKEKELLDKLEAFENSELFLSNQMSLPLLAAEMETNIKYLSEVIRKFKNKNFNSYINELRIQHVVNLLKTDPAYLNYKVSYLAEISGFSSHSAFTAIFKTITGISPNDFIKKISEQNK